MNLIPAYLKKTWLAVIVSTALCCVLSSCDNAIYDDEGDCSVVYRLKFRYDRNMKRADAFAREVKSVRLYAFDNSGTLVWQKSERGDALAADDYTMMLDLPAGDYRLVAWCGLDNDDENGESFSVPETEVGKTRIEDLQCSLNRVRGEAGAYSKGKLHSLFHGMLNVSLPSNDDGGDYTYTMDLTKDTNHVRVILQHLSGKEVNVNDFTFRIEDENGLMNYDNSLLTDEVITYKTYHTGSGTTTMGYDDYPEPGASAKAPSSRAITSVSVAVADLSVARLMADRRKDVFLIIDSDNGAHNVARIPLIDYALMLKDGYDVEGMDTDQDYLDFQDEYALVLFLDEKDEWPKTSIIINSWKLVLNDIDFGK